MEYDEQTELTRYVWNNYLTLMTDFERRVGSAIVGRRKAATCDGTQARMLREQWGLADDPEVNAALADGPETFRERVRRRVISERGNEVFINRCPSCERVVRTPRARQCFWCGHSWHGLRAQPDDTTTN